MLIVYDEVQKSEWDEVQRIKNDPVRIAQKRKEEESMYEIPFLHGTRVCLNPEGDRFEVLNGTARGTAGYVLRIDIDEDSLVNWKKLLNKQRISVLVEFDNGLQSWCEHKDLLQVDAKPKTIIEMRFKSSSIMFFKEDDNEAIKRANKIVIVNGDTMRMKKEYNNEWRASIIQSIMSVDDSSMSKQSKK